MIMISVGLYKLEFGDVIIIECVYNLGPGISKNGPHGPYYQVSFL